MNRPDCRYWGFLSYSHTDEAAAARLHRALEGYALPSAVRRAHGLPRRLVPVFRDVEELEVAPGLTSRLRAALDDSRWLIVLCSPAAAQSRYVNEEIEYFLKAHGASRVLCVLLEGNPPECFPPALRALPEEPLAADLRPGRDPELARLRLVAAMAVVGFTDLRNREAQRSRRRRLGVAAVAAAIGGGALAYWDLFHREHVGHYLQYVREHAIWRGVDAIPPAVAARRGESYRFTRHGRLNPPDRVDYVDAMGRCPDNGMQGTLGSRPEMASAWQPASRYCSVHFSYDRDGELARETWTNERGRPLETLAYTGEGLAQFTMQGFSTAASPGGVQYLQFERDAAGRDVRVLFLHSRGVPRPNEQRHFGYRREYDAAGRVVLESALDDRGQDIGEITRKVYDDRGNVLEERYEDATGAPRARKEGFHAMRFEHDDAGNWVRQTLLDAAGSPVIGAEGFAITRATRDGRGRTVELAHLDTAGRPVTSRYGYAFVRTGYDAAGNDTRWEFLDTERRPVAVNGGFAAIESVFDPLGQPLENRYYDAAGQLTDSLVGAIVRNRYDELGRELEECFFDPQDRPAVKRWGHCVTRRFDERDNIVEFAFLDADRKPFGRRDRAGGAVAKIVIHRGPGGFITGGENLDADLRPVLGGNCGCAVYENRSDDFGNVVERLRYDGQRRLVAGSDGAAIHRLKYDRSGNVIEETYYGIRQEPVRVREGYYGYRARYDSRGRMVEKRFLGPSGEPLAEAGTGAFGVRYEYDPLGEVAAETYLDASGAATGRLEVRRDRYGLPVERRFADADGQPAPHPRTGCAVQQYEGYGTWGWEDPSLERCLDAGHRPTNRRDGGWATRTALMRDGRLTEEFRDARGRPVTPRP